MSDPFYDTIAAEALPESSGANGEWFKFANVGDTARGKVVDRMVRDNFTKDGKEVVFVLENGGVYTNLPITQAIAKSEVAKKRPDMGDYVEFVYVKDGERKGGFQPPKVIELTVSKEAPEWYQGSEDEGLL